MVEQQRKRHEQYLRSLEPGGELNAEGKRLCRAPTPVHMANAPYVIALIDLDEGTRMFANVVGEGAHATSIGDRVRVVFEDRGNGAKMP